MNTIQKIIASSVVNGTAAYLLGDVKNSFSKNFIGFSIFSGLPIITDKLINQNITSNKAIQYGLTAAEVALEWIVMEGCFHEFKEFFDNNVSDDFNNTQSLLGIFQKVETFLSLAYKHMCNFSKFIEIITPLSFAHKYIWDQPNDTHVEFDQSKEIIIPIDALETIQESI